MAEALTDAHWATLRLICMGAYPHKDSLTGIWWYRRERVPVKPLIEAGLVYDRWGRALPTEAGYEADERHENAAKRETSETSETSEKGE
jgi:hypothetical protein